MKQLKIKSTLLLSALVALASCSKFEETNISPKDANDDQVQVEYFINNSIIGAQMDPHIAERVFVLYWKSAGHQQFGGGISSGTPDDGWSTDYFRYLSEWLNHANTAVQTADIQIAAGNIKEYTSNLRQVARIWRAYLMSEMADNFGPIPINGFQGVNPDYSSVKDVYYFILDELKDASAKLDPAVVNPADLTKLDPAYGYNWEKWKRYANSMRLRLAMRLSEVDAAKAKAEFEAAAALPLLTATDHIFQVQEIEGWNALSGVMSREWNAQILSTTLENIYTGLGGIPTTDQVPTSLQPMIKPANWAGLKLTDHFTTMTNEPYAGFWMDGLPAKIDPRAYKAFPLAGDFNNPDFTKYPSYDRPSWETTKRSLVNAANAVVKELDGAFTWNGTNAGDWGVKGTRNQWRGWSGAAPRLAFQFRNSKSKRIFFAPWETYFLLAEAAVKGWTVPMAGKAAYEAGIDASFTYFGVSSFAAAYKASTDFNRTGTSVSWDHVAEPPASYAMDFKDGYTNAAGTATILYPVNNLYKGGAVKNDLLTKIITQKYIAQTPWLPLEAWSDHRRLGLPFIENPAIENPLPNLPDLNAGNYMTSNVKFFPQRLAYPSSLRNTNGKGYAQAVSSLGGADNVRTPLWWAKKP
jgi:hypothetical protein